MSDENTLNVSEWLKIAGLLREQEEEDEDTGDIFDDEAGDTDDEKPEEESSEEKTEEKTEEKAEEDTEDSEDKEDEPETKEKVDAEPTDVETFDTELDTMFADFETSAITQVENLSLSKTLLEQEKRFDVVKFADDVARVIKNFTSLIDYEKMVVNKAKVFLSDKHSEDVAELFIDILDDRHGISLEPEEPDQPVYALGAMKGE